ncbi:MAG: type II CAAX endopeptidase family protein [Bacteroidota bacterium]
MQKVYSKGFNGWSQLAILLGLVGGGILATVLISFLIWISMTDGSILNMEKDMLKPENANAIQVLQAASALFMFFIPTVAFASICYRNKWTFLGFKEKLNPKALLIVLLIVAVSIPMMGLLEQINRAIPLPATTRVRFDDMEERYNEQVLLMVQLKTWGQYFISLFIIAVLPAITEEMVFRGGLQNLLTRWMKSPWAAILITSFLFSAIHWSWYGFIVRFALGVVLGLIFYYTKNIWLNILLHFLNNALVVTSLFITARQGKPLDMTPTDSFPLIVGVAGLILMVVLMRWLINSSPNPVLEENRIDVFDRRNPFDERNV